MNRESAAQPGVRSLPASIDATLELLGEADYLADRSLATVLFLALRMGRPLFLEGEAGVGKTEIAKVLAQDVPLEQKVAMLVDAANANGGRDNISVLVAQANEGSRKKGLISRLLGK